MSTQSLESVRAEALFVSDVQCSEHLTAERVREAVARSVRRHGALGCAALVAEEFGEHPETAVPRMSWILATVRQVYRVPRRHVAAPPAAGARIATAPANAA